MLTRFHAYNIGSGILCFTYAAGESFMLVGTHYDEQTRQAIIREMSLMGVSTISTLFIPDWSDAYCSTNQEIRQLLNELEPTYILVSGNKGRSQNSTRIYSHLTEYQKDHTFAIVKELPKDEQRTIRQFESSRQNVLIMLPTKNSVPTSNDKLIRACRFDSSGKMITTDLLPTTPPPAARTTDIAVVASLDVEVSRNISESLVAKNAAVLVKCVKTTQLEKLGGRAVIPETYIVENDDVVAMSDNPQIGWVYYYNSRTRIISKRNPYNP